MKNPYYIVAPRYTRTSAGVKVLYKLADKIDVFQPGKKLVIHNLTVLPDLNSKPPYNSVWAEVGVP
jgi:hypothetical protein